MTTEPEEEKKTHFFSPNEHLIQLKSKEGLKDYLPVQWRIAWFREKFPHGQIETEELVYDMDREVEAEVFVWNAEKKRSEKTIKCAKGYARYRTVARDGQGGVATGTKSESAVNFADFGEKAETGSVGRALANLGYGTQFAGEEFDEGARIVDSPVERTGTEEAVPEASPTTAEPPQPPVMTTPKPAPAPRPTPITTIPKQSPAPAPKPAASAPPKLSIVTDLSEREKLESAIVLTLGNLHIVPAALQFLASEYGDKVTAVKHLTDEQLAEFNQTVKNVEMDIVWCNDGLADPGFSRLLTSEVKNEQGRMVREFYVASIFSFYRHNGMDDKQKQHLAQINVRYYRYVLEHIQLAELCKKHSQKNLNTIVDSINDQRIGCNMEPIPAQVSVKAA